jgi:5-formyltetrahydrofolate cyclo-ligase
MGRGVALVFRPWRADGPLEAGTFGTRHPALENHEVPDWLLVPLLAYDFAGHRLGYGGGYYDRSLAGLRACRPVVAVGLAAEEDEVADLPAGPTDQRLDGVLTPVGLRWFGHSA